MPEHARALTELLQEHDQWKQNISGVFIAARHDANASQTSFANSLGISQPYLNQIEHGKRTPSSETLSKLRSYVEGGPSADDQSQEDHEESR